MGGIKKIYSFLFFLREGGGEWKGVARVSEFFLTKNPNLKIFFCVCVCGGGGCLCVCGVGGGGRCRQRDKQAQTNLPLHILQSWGHNNA